MSFIVLCFSADDFQQAEWLLNCSLRRTQQIALSLLSQQRRDASMETWRLEKSTGWKVEERGRAMTFSAPSKEREFRYFGN